MTILRTLAVALAAAWLVPSPAAADKSYTIVGIHIQARVQDDGSLRVEEEISYSFSGSFSYAYREIVTEKGESVRDFSVAEERRGSSGPSDQRTPLPFDVDAGRRKTKITWHYNAYNELRTFVFGYTVDGVVKRYLDAVELYYKFVGEDWDRQIAAVSVRVHPIPGVDGSTVRAWAHGPLDGYVSVPGDGSAYLSVAPLPARTFWEGRIVYPESALPDVTYAAPEMRLEQILAEEARWAEEANERRAAARRRVEGKPALLKLSALVGAAGLLLWAFLFVRYSWPLRPALTSAPGEIPDDLPPALVARLQGPNAVGPMFTSTLLDLARRGHFEIHEQERQVWRLLGSITKPDYYFRATGKERHDLQPFEAELMTFLDGLAEGEGGFRMSEVTRKHRGRLLSFVRPWGETIRARFEELGWREKAPSEALRLNAICGIGVALAGAALCVWNRSEAGAPAIVLGFLQVILTLALGRLSPEGKRQYLHWKGFGKHLDSIAKMLGPPSLTSAEWARYMVYAVALGKHRKVLPALARMIPEDDHRSLTWYRPMHGGLGATDLGQIGQGISGMVSSVSSSFSSATGSSGGASGGGGGGGGAG